MAIRERLSGNEAVATAMKQINPDVMAAFPITPSTEIPQYFSQFVANGTVDTEFVAVESEHSAMSACIGASTAGARTCTATSANGLALMWEMLYIAASNRLPIVLATVNRALSGPINIHNDHSDSMGARDSGWLQLYSETNQEAYDNMIMAFRIAEHEDVNLPVMVCQDGFITSHAIENIDLVEDDKVKEFVGEYTPAQYLLNRENPMAAGPLDMPPYYMEHKYQQVMAAENAKKVVLDVAADFEKMTGRKYGFFEEYKLDDAEVAIVIINSTAGTAKATIDQLRDKGVKAGLLKIRMFRPFPAKEIMNALKHVKVVAVMDKSDMFATSGGPVFNEVRSAMYDVADKVKIISYIYGLGGKDVRTDDIETVYNHLSKIAESGQVDTVYNYLGIRE